ncbi:MAG TPA: NTP transferase domain-containing protein, partial [Acidimicrobiia bacterium]|nr:NTP transferase domain-containing protein [Acidimicrobiia bacterium]
EVVVAGKPQGWEGRRGLTDPPGLVGPLAGLMAALGEGHDLVAVGVDQPWLRSETLRRLVDLDGTAVPVDEGVRQVTCARYAADLADDVGRASSVQDLLALIPHQTVDRALWQTWGEDGRSWYSVDDGKALAMGLERYGPPG